GGFAAVPKVDAALFVVVVFVPNPKEGAFVLAFDPNEGALVIAVDPNEGVFVAVVDPNRVGLLVVVVPKEVVDPNFDAVFPNVACAIFAVVELKEGADVLVGLLLKLFQNWVLGAVKPGTEGADIDNAPKLKVEPEFPNRFVGMGAVVVDAEALVVVVVIPNLKAGCAISLPEYLVVSVEGVITVNPGIDDALVKASVLNLNDGAIAGAGFASSDVVVDIGGLPNELLPNGEGLANVVEVAVTFLIFNLEKVGVVDKVVIGALRFPKLILPDPLASGVVVITGAGTGTVFSTVFALKENPRENTRAVVLVVAVAVVEAVPNIPVKRGVEAVAAVSDNFVVSGLDPKKDDPDVARDKLGACKAVGIVINEVDSVDVFGGVVLLEANFCNMKAGNKGAAEVEINGASVEVLLVAVKVLSVPNKNARGLLIDAFTISKSDTVLASFGLSADVVFTDKSFLSPNREGTSGTAT
ncbi:hypothetical protein HK098_007294, partial [Nowakowskiella sp. JEL0407]